MTSQTPPSIPYTDAELFATGPQKTYTGEALREIAFPLGGIGSGCISFSGRGALVDWEIFNRPNKGFVPDLTFFSLFAQAEGGEPVFRVMEGRLQPPFQGPLHWPRHYSGFGFGPPQAQGAGLLRFAECAFTGAFPFATVDLSDPTVPVKVSVDAWSPFMPLNDRDSSLPVAIFDITLTNTADKPVDAAVALSVENLAGYPDMGQNLNCLVREDGLNAIAMTTAKHAPDSPKFGSLCIATPDADITWELCRDRAAWFRGTEILIDGFGQTGRFTEEAEMPPTSDGPPPVGSLGIRRHLKSGESATVTLVFAWHFPNAAKYWDAPPACDCADPESCRPAWKNYYATQWADALDVARYTVANFDRLKAATRRFQEAFFASTLPTYVLDSVSSQMAILRSPTVLRLSDGAIWGWEGCHKDAGCCPGSCSHVWGYTQTMAYLFPQLERQCREMDYTTNLRDTDGHMQFRQELPLGAPANHDFHAAADGQMAGILRTYREWQLCGDDNWLRQLWPDVKRALEYAWVAWDKDRDGLLEGVHHNTLDIEYHGSEPVCGSLYLAALLAGEKIARHLGDPSSAEEYRRVFDSGRRLMDETQFNGEYYFQAVTPGDDAPYQYGPGCICDQVIGQWHARVYGLGDVLDPAHVKSAIQSVFRYNFRKDMFAHHNPHRVFALNDDAGLFICTWPKGGRPEVPVTYAYETMIGFEYQVGAHLIYEGFLREGLSVCKAIRDRHDGLKRNPWNEFECGSHYARSMANYAYITALTGFQYSAVDKSLTLSPRINEDDFQCFFSVDGAWGTLTRRRTEDGEWSSQVEVIEGELKLKSFCGTQFDEMREIGAGEMLVAEV
jgi:uncharacterized protein (DUF608 family)